MVTGPDGPSSRFMNLEQMLVVRIGEGATARAGVATAAADVAGFAKQWRTWAQ
jgi:hypothetical protein